MTIHRLAGRFGVGVIRPEGIDRDQRTTCGPRSSGRDGTLRKVYGGNDWTPGTVLADMRAALRTP